MALEWVVTERMLSMKIISISRETSTLQTTNNGTLGEKNHNSNSSEPTTDGQEPSRYIVRETSVSDSGKDLMVKVNTTSSISHKMTRTLVNYSERESSLDPTSISRSVMVKPMQSLRSASLMELVFSS
jgi:hypothetical protein